MTIDIDNRQDAVAVDLEELAGLFRRCLESLGLERAELSIVLAEEAEMTRLNRDRMGVDRPTDVLAFPQLEFAPERFEAQLRQELARLPEAGELALGDVVLCPEVILAQAPADPWSVREPADADPGSALVGRCPEPPGPESQFHLVAVHGLLHLLGHDHAELGQARAMAAEQERLLELVFGATVLSEPDLDEAKPGVVSASAQGPAEGSGFRAGYVALIGRPNVGKSTLMNAMVGAKVSITSPKPQTTRNRIVGILTDERAQVLFIDTPGLHQARDRFNRRLVAAALESLADADLVCLMIEPSATPGPESLFVLEVLRGVHAPKLLLINKLDKVPKQAVLPVIDEYRKLAEWEEIFPISALDGTNLGPLLEAIVARLPEGPALYPADQLTDQSERFLVAETVREKVLDFAHKEVPYATALVVDRWEETPGLLRMAATIHVERPSQKAILIGRGGSMLKRIGTAARKDLERFFACKIYLELHVSVSERWRQSEPFLRSQNL
jgi:GTP-binding protein Era